MTDDLEMHAAYALADFAAVLDALERNPKAAEQFRRELGRLADRAAVLAKQSNMEHAA